MLMQVQTLPADVCNAAVGCTVSRKARWGWCSAPDTACVGVLCQ